MAEENKTTTRKKPRFLRVGWHKMIKLGRGVKKNQKWHGAKGRQNKIRLNRKGRSRRPKIGWGADNSEKNFVGGMEAVRIENVSDLNQVGKGRGVIVAKVGMKKRKEIIAKANEMKIKVLNKYKTSVGSSGSGVGSNNLDNEKKTKNGDSKK